MEGRRAMTHLAVIAPSLSPPSLCPVCSLANVGQKRHKPGSFNRQGHGVLANRHAAALTPADDLSVAVDQLFEQLDVLIIDEHRARSHAIDPNRVLLLRLQLRLRALAWFGVLFVEAGRKGHGVLIANR